VRVQVKIEGLQQAQQRLNRELAKIKVGVREGLLLVGLDCLGKSVPDAPVDKGDLRGSGYLDYGGTLIARGQKDGSTVRKGRPHANCPDVAEIGFGTPYAVRQHEELQWRHPKGGKAKYLEDVVKNNTDRWVRMIYDKAKAGR